MTNISNPQPEITIPLNRPPLQPQPKSRVGFLGNLSVPQKIGFLSLLLGIPALALSANIAYSYYEQIQNSREALQSFTLTEQLYAIEEDITGAQLGIFENSTEVIQNSVQELDTEIPIFRTLIKENTYLNSEDTEYFNDKYETWISMIKAAEDPTVLETNPEFLQVSYDLVLNALPRVYTQIGSTGALHSAVEPENVLQSAIAISEFNHVVAPNNRQQAGRISTDLVAAYQAIGADGILPEAAQSIAEDRLRFSRRAFNNIIYQFRLATQEFPNDEGMQQALANLESSVDKAVGFYTRNIIETNQPAQSLSDYLEILPELREAYSNIFIEAINTQKDYHANRIQYNTNLFLIALAVILVLLVLISFLAISIIRSIVNPLERLTRAANNLSGGIFSTRVPITSNDELGKLALSFNTAAAELEENEQRVERERLEQEQLQNNIGQFLDVTMEIAEGNLTKRGIVTEDVLGNVVDSINLMTEELSYVLSDVQNASKSVADGSQAMLNTTSQIQEGTAMTAAEAQRVAQQVQELTNNIRQMAEQAQQSADAARQALIASQQGQEAVTGTLDGMQNIRREVQGVAKSIKGLGDRSLEIQEIVDTISGIARQTNLLALNATIEAAGAGEAGGRFSIVADEVRKLADNSANATGRIATLIQNIQSEIQDVVINVEESTREVEQGYRVAGTAGERLREIGELTQQSARLAENISSATRQQVDGVEQMGNAVQQIAQIARRSEESVEQGRAAADQLQRLADELNASLARFRLQN